MPAKKPLPPLFEDVPDVPARDRAALAKLCSNEKACREWLAADPGERLVKRAILIEIDRGVDLRHPVLNSLVAKLMSYQRQALAGRIIQHLKV